MRISARTGGSMDFSYYIMDEEVYADMKMTFQPKKRQRAKVHGFRARMSSAGGRKVLAARRAKVEQNYLLNERGRNRVIDCGLS